MNILLVTLHSPFPEMGSRFYGGAEISLRTIGEMLAARGHNVYYLTSGRESVDPRLISGIRVFGFRQHHLPILHKGPRVF